MTHTSPTPPEPDSRALEELQKDLDDMKLGWQRTQADFENFRRRTRDEQAVRTASEVARALTNFIPIAENLRRSLTEMQAKTELPADITAWISGVTQIARQFDQALVSAGLSPIDPTAGEPFRPHEHEAVSQMPHASQPVDTVIQTVERGYRASDRVLIPAKVVVSAGPPADSKQA